MTPVVMPQIGENLTTGCIVEWLKEENDPVEKGEVLLTVESEKAVFEVEAESSGVLTKILHQAGEEVEVFEPLAYIGRSGEMFAEQEEAEEEEKTEAETAAAQVEIVGHQLDADGSDSVNATPQRGRVLATAPREAGNRSRIFASPSARRLARELEVDLARVRGSGPEGRIVKRDVADGTRSEGRIVKRDVANGTRSEGYIVKRDVAEGIPATMSGDRIVPFAGLRQWIAGRMTLSNQTIPHLYLFADVDMSAAVAWLEQVNGGAGISITTLIIRATALALRQFERMNAHVETGRLILKKGIHIGVATAVEDGLLVPAVVDADRKGLDEIDAICRENAAAASRGVVKLHPATTFTITDLGMYDITRFLPVINPPECAMLAVGAVEERVVPVGRAIGVRELMTLTLACDHRSVDGIYAAQFLNLLKQILENLEFAPTTSEMK